MRKNLLAAASVCLLGTHLYGGGDISIQKVDIEPIQEKHGSHAESPFYIVGKMMIITGDDVDHGHGITLDGDRGTGLGIDVGYRLNHNFAIEYDFSYASDTITEINGHHELEADATYYAHALHLVYSQHLTEKVGFFLKAGYEYEKEKIDDLNIDSHDDGFAYGAGLEYNLNSHYALIAEYEGTTIEGPRGDAIFIGIMYNF